MLLFNRILFCSVSLALSPCAFGQSSANSTASADSTASANSTASAEGTLVFTVGSVSVRRYQVGGQARASLSRDGGRSWQPLANPCDLLYFRLAQFDPIRGPALLPGAMGAPHGTRLFVVQFQTQILAEYQQAVRDRGVQIIGYMPENALYVRADSARALALRDLPCVRNVGPLQNGFKLDPALTEFVQKGGDQPLECNLVLADKQDRMVLAQQIAELGGRVTELCDPAVYLQAKLTPAQLLAVLERDTVVWADPSPSVGVDMDNARVQGGANYIETVAGFNGSGVRAEITEGLDQTHPDWTNPVVERTDNLQNHGHCTAMIVGGNGSGNPAAKGVLPNGTIIENSYIQLGAGQHAAMIIGSTNPALPWHSMVATSSWGSAQTPNYTSVSLAVDDALFLADLVRCQSMSNLGTQSVRPEAWAKNTISVGGVRHLDNSNPADDTWTTASIGPAADGRIKPEVTCYYDLVLCGDRPGTSGYNTAAGIAGNYYTGFNGTSSATPITAGHVGLIQQMFTDGVFGNPLPFPATSANRFQNKPHMTTSKALLCNTAAQYSFSGLTANLTRSHQGWGFPSLQTVYDNRNKLVVLDEYDVLQMGESRTYLVFIAPGTAEFRATMVYADPAGQAGAIIQRVNNVNLKVTRLSDGQFFWGNNGLDANMTSTQGGVANDRDTIECVYLGQPTAGVYMVSLMAESVVVDGHTETPALDVDCALAMHPLGGGYRTDRMALALSSATTGDLRVNCSNVPVTGWTDGCTFFSFNTFGRPSFGSFFGLEADFITSAIYSLPATPGDVFRFTPTAAYPFTPYVFPASLAAALTGLTVEGMVTLFNGGAIVAQSNVARVTIQ